MQKPFPKATVGGYVFAEDETILLLSSYKWPNLLSSPGGKVCEGETLEEAFCREIREETGLEVEEVTFLSCQDVIYSKEHHQKKHLIFHSFTARLKKDFRKEDVRLNHEAQNYCWLKIEEALKRPLTKQVYDDLKKIEAKKRFQITLKEISLPLFLGVYPHEQTEKQQVFFTVTYPFVFDSSLHEDRLENVVNYEEILSSLKEFCGNRRFSLIETLAHEAAILLKKRFSLSSIGITVRKEAPLPEMGCAEVKVEI